jgi:hypothetical protein
MHPGCLHQVLNASNVRIDPPRAPGHGLQAKWSKNLAKNANGIFHETSDSAVSASYESVALES